ncbi:membrane protein [Nocardia vulneris]|uniref:Membrane protein n=2 Tax=Nocardia vulneris TaxID=1141657 RepID=A0ABR4Z3T3_9NOCA|nr:membrane protein [Nocardia vulneris]
MIMLVIGLALLAVFLVRFRKDRRRLGNGVYLLLGLIFVGVWVLGSGVKGDLPMILAGLLVLLSPLLVLVLAGLLILNGRQMVRREGLRLANLLPLGLGLALLVPYVLLALAIFTGDIWVVVILASLTMAVSYIGFLFASFLLYSLLYGALPYRPGMDAIVVHGAGLKGDRVPPLLAGRLDRAIEVYRAEHTAGRRPLLITSGGKGSDELKSEAEAMAGYLVERGIPAESVLQEDRSATTRENLLFTKRLLGERGESTRMVLVTSDFHTLRTAMLARRLGLDAEVTGARTAFYYLPAATLREFAAVVVAYKWINLIACVALVSLPILALLLTRDLPHNYGD